MWSELAFTKDSVNRTIWEDFSERSKTNPVALVTKT